MHALENARALEVKDGLPDLLPVLAGEDQLRLARAGNAHFAVAVHVPIGVTGDGDGLFPGAHGGGNPLDQDGRAEHRAAHHGADGGIGTLPHLMQVVFLHALSVGGDGGALYRHAQAHGCLGAVDGNLVPGGIPVGQAQVIIFRFQIHIWLD